MMEGVNSTIVRTFVNVIMYPQYKDIFKNLKIKVLMPTVHIVLSQ
jgi:hypothetical protein